MSLVVGAMLGGADLGSLPVEGGEDIVEGGDGGGGEALQAMAVVGAKGAQLLLGQRLVETLARVMIRVADRGVGDERGEDHLRSS